MHDIVGMTLVSADIDLRIVLMPSADIKLCIPGRYVSKTARGRV